MREHVRERTRNKRGKKKCKRIVTGNMNEEPDIFIKKNRIKQYRALRLDLDNICVKSLIFVIKGKTV